MNRGMQELPARDVHNDEDDRRRRPVIFGELLYDSFPDGARVLGGAPFNVAWHLAGLGLNPLLVTRVGDDEAGRQALEAMASWGLDRAAVQVDAHRATGEVQVTLEGGEPEFTIAPAQAWDFIDAETAATVLDEVKPALVYHGTLAARHECSATALRTLRARIPTRFVDLNLRAPWWGAESVAEAVAAASWLKLNRDEMTQLEPGLAATGDEAAAAELKRHHHLNGVVLTLGADGAVIAADETLSASPHPAELGRDADPVGAGDAFAAACIAGLLEGRPLAEILAGAVSLAARLCTVRGALLHDREWYHGLFGPRK